MKKWNHLGRCAAIPFEDEKDLNIPTSFLEIGRWSRNRMVFRISILGGEGERSGL